jgi:hypothetical protein
MRQPPYYPRYPLFHGDQGSFEGVRSKGVQHQNITRIMASCDGQSTNSDAGVAGHRRQRSFREPQTHK